MVSTRAELNESPGPAPCPFFAGAVTLSGDVAAMLLADRKAGDR